MEILRRRSVKNIVARLGLIALGAGGGYAYYAFIGCYGSACPITSNPWLSTAYGAVIGGLLLPLKRTPEPEQPMKTSHNPKGS